MTTTETSPRADIATRDDIRRLVVEFYTRAFQDELLRFVFVDVAQMDLDEHLPVMCDFWGTVLLGERSYRGGAFQPHARLHEQVPLTEEHFQRWLAIWTRTVDDLFDGEVAIAAKLRAASVADAFLRRLGQPTGTPVCVYRYAGPATPT
jgi:hemoglobin